MTNSFTVTITTNFWTYTQTVSSFSKETAIAQVMHKAIHQNHDGPGLLVKEASAVVATSLQESVPATKGVERTYFNQIY